MAQPLPHTEFAHTEFEEPDYSTGNGLDASAARLERAFRRLEAATNQIGTGYASLKAEREKLNHLLLISGQEVEEMRKAVQLVSGRLDHTIATLEALEQ